MPFRFFDHAPVEKCDCGGARCSIMQKYFIVRFTLGPGLYTQWLGLN
jgi:hypothetical protein